MRPVKKMITPTRIFLAILLLLISSFNQSALAAMIGTENLLETDRNQETRAYLQQLISRERIQNALVARGINPSEAQARINSLSDGEIERIAAKIDILPAGGGVTGFVLIVGAVVLILIIIVEYTSVVKMFPQFQPSK
jgi:hypothetical protein